MLRTSGSPPATSQSQALVPLAKENTHSNCDSKKWTKLLLYLLYLSEAKNRETRE